MKLKIEIPKIHCKRTTIEMGKDEIYAGVIAFAGKIENGEFVKSVEQPIFASLTEVKDKVSKGTIWNPILQNELFEVDDNISLVCISLLLFEEDNGKHYQKLQENFNDLLLPGKFEWSRLFEVIMAAVKDYYAENGEQFVNLKKAFKDNAIKTVEIVGTAMFKVMKSILKHIRQDDSLGVFSTVVDFSQPGFDFDREKAFEKFRGKYYASLKISKV